MDSPSANSGEKTYSPTEISKLALQFLTLCGEDATLMKRVYTASMSLMGVATEVAAPVKAKSGKEVAPSAPKEVPPSKRDLTSDEVRLAKEDFRKRNEIKGKLTPEQAKMAKALFRQKLELKFYKDRKVPVPSISRPQGRSRDWSGSSDEEDSKPSASRKGASADARKPEGSKQLPSDGSRRTWSTKMKLQRQRALERSLEMQDSKEDCVAMADYYNSRVTLADTWERFQNTYDCSGKKNPLKDLPPLPDLDEIRKKFKQEGFGELRTHESGQIILQNELTGQSLRKK
jgi:hypothetical protein